MDVPRRGELEGDLRVESRSPWNFPSEMKITTTKKTDTTELLLTSAPFSGLKFIFPLQVLRSYLKPPFMLHLYVRFLQTHPPHKKIAPLSELRRCLISLIWQ